MCHRFHLEYFLSHAFFFFLHLQPDCNLEKNVITKLEATVENLLLRIGHQKEHAESRCRGN